MTAQPPGGSDFATRLTQAIKRYEAGWKPVDSELYGLCRRRPRHDDFADVYTKVAVIGRVYAAGISRNSKAEGDREASVANGLVTISTEITDQLSDIANAELDRSTFTQMLKLHAKVCQELLAHTGNTWQQSFVSKYLHFHCPIVPIFDSRAEGAIGRFVDWPTVYGLRTVVGRERGWPIRYYNFTTAFMVLYEQSHAETNLKPSVKELDYLLWQPK
jgi:hypothetical protein